MAGDVLFFCDAEDPARVERAVDGVAPFDGRVEAFLADVFLAGFDAEVVAFLVPLVTFAPAAALLDAALVLFLVDFEAAEALVAVFLAALAGAVDADFLAEVPVDAAFFEAAFLAPAFFVAVAFLAAFAPAAFFAGATMSSQI